MITDIVDVCVTEYDERVMEKVTKSIVKRRV